MLVEFKRKRSTYEHDEDGEVVGQTPIRVLINPALVSAVMPSTDHQDCTVVRGPDGRGLLLDEAYASVKRRLGAEDQPVHVTGVGDNPQPGEGRSTFDTGLHGVT